MVCVRWTSLRAVCVGQGTSEHLSSPPAACAGPRGQQRKARGRHIGVAQKIDPLARNAIARQRQTNGSIVGGRDRRIEQLLKQTDIIDIVMNYEPSESVRKQIQREGLKMVTGTLTGAGHKLAQGARSAVTAIGASGEKRRAFEAQAKDERKQRFEDIVNGR